MVALFMLIWWLAVLNPEKDPPPFGKALAMSIGGTIALVLFLALVYRYTPSTIMIQQDWIRRIRGNSFRDFRYKDIESYSIELKTIDGYDFPILSLTTKKGKALSTGIAASVALDELEKILSEQMSPTKYEDLQHGIKDLNPNL